MKQRRLGRNALGRQAELAVFGSVTRMNRMSGLTVAPRMATPGLGLLLLAAVVIDSIASGSPDVVGLLLSLLAIFGVPRLLVGRCWRLFGTSGTYTIDEWGVQRHSTLTQHGYGWSALSGIDELPGQLIFTTGKAGFLPMSTAALLPDDREHLLAMAAQKGVLLN